MNWPRSETHDGPDKAHHLHPSPAGGRGVSQDEDRTLEALLAETAELRTRLRAEQAGDQPPAHLDAAILAASRRAVSSRPVIAGGPSGLRRWRGPLAAAAVVVLATSVVLVSVEDDSFKRIVVPTASSPTVSTDAREADSSANGNVNVPKDRTLEVPSPDGAARREDAGRSQAARERLVEKTPAVPREVPAMPFRQRQDSAAAAGSAESAAQQAPGADSMRQKADQAPAPIESAKDLAEAPASAPAVSPRSDAPTPSAAPPAKAAIEAPAAAEAERESGTLSKAHRDAFLGAQSRSAAPTPENQLQRIRARWEAGDRSGARDALAAFLREHPGYRLPSGFPVPPPPEFTQERPAEDR